MQLQAIVRGFLLRKKLKISKCQPDLNYFDDASRSEYIDSSGLPYFSEMDSRIRKRVLSPYKVLPGRKLP